MVVINVPSTDGAITYSPPDSWKPFAATGAMDGQGEFLTGDTEHNMADAYITYTFSQAATGFEFWAWQRADGGLFSLQFDTSSTFSNGYQLSALNASVSNENVGPVCLYAIYDLPYAVHNVTIANLFDARATYGGVTGGGYGQMSLDHFVLIVPQDTSTSQVLTATSTSAGSATSPASPAQATTSAGGAPSSGNPAPSGGAIPFSSSAGPTATSSLAGGTSSTAEQLPSGSSDTAAPSASRTTPNNSGPSLTSSSSSASDLRSPLRVGSIIGTVLGTLAALAALTLLLWVFLSRRRKQKQKREARSASQYVLSSEEYDMGRSSLAPGLGVGLGLGEKGRSLSSSRAGEDHIHTGETGSVEDVARVSSVLPHSASLTWTERAMPASTRRATLTATDAAHTPNFSSSATQPISRQTITHIGPRVRRESDAGFLQGDEDHEDEDEERSEMSEITLPPDYDAATAARRRAGAGA